MLYSQFMRTARRDKKITLADIAGRAGCSTNTASLALRNSPRISPDLRRTIRRIADKLQYTPDFAARNLRVRRSGVIGIYTRGLYDAGRVELVNHLLSALHTTQYRPVLGLGQGNSGSWHESDWMRTFRELRAEALVVLWESMDSLPEWSRTIPIILVGCNPAESLGCDYLALDRKQAGALGTRHLLSRGKRNILLGSGPGSEFGKGCMEALREAKVKPFGNPCEIGSGLSDQARSIGYTMACQSARPDGAVFPDSGIAAHFMQGILEAGREVPDDMAVVGYDYFPWASALAVPLTTVEQPIGSMASSAVDLVRRRLADPDAPPVHIVQPHSLMARKSS